MSLTSRNFMSRLLQCAAIVLLGFSLLACGGDSDPGAPTGDRGGQDNQGNTDDDGDTDDDDSGAGAGDDDGSGDPGDDNDKPTATLSVGDVLGAKEMIAVTFSEPMDRDTLNVGGTLARGATVTWKSEDALELATATYWPAGVQTLVIDASDAEGLAMDTLETSIDVKSGFATFQSATVVIGQPDFNSGAPRQVPDAPMPGANTLDRPSSAVDYVAETNRLYIPDSFDKRVLVYNGIPDVNNANADAVIGQPDFHTSNGGTSQEAVRVVHGISAQAGHLMIADPDSHRVTIYRPLPESGVAAADVVLGQANYEDFNNACGPLRMNHVHNQFVTPGGKLLVADSNNNRVLVWNTIPDETGVPPDLVIGQSRLDTCAHNDNDQNGVSIEDGLPSARTLRHPTGIWSDGERLVIADNYNNRVLLWHEFPAENFAPADVVLGQGSMALTTPNDDNMDGAPDAAPSARVVDYPWSVWFDKGQLFVADANNNRVLVWNGWPTESFAPADFVIGQADFTGNSPNAGNDVPAANTLNHPMGVRVIHDKLLVTDTGNSRVLVFEAE
ncbi:MAG TPA: hypothetical protein VF267_09400 [Gammaproteobacteria bacterium]